MRSRSMALGCRRRSCYGGRNRVDRPCKINGEMLAMMLARGLLAATIVLGAGAAAAQDIKIAHVYDKTGPLEAYAKQTQRGFLPGSDSPPQHPHPITPPPTPPTPKPPQPT